MLFISHSESETEEIGKKVASLVSGHDLIAMYGEMASGKTVFARGFVRFFFPEALVTSPTYALLNQYAGEDLTINHFDLYRIESEDDLASIGFWDVIENGITLLEWSENVSDLLPVPRWDLVFVKTGESEREIRLEKREC